MNSNFDGRATIRVRFRNRAEYEKFRKYILKTEWSYALDYPMWEEMTVDFHCTDDVDLINRNVVRLLQMGFEVYCCRFQLEEHLAEEQHPPEGDTNGDIMEDLEPFDIGKIVSDAWKAIGGK